MNPNILPVDLWIIMPVYNEEATVEAVIHEWISELRTLDITFVFCILDDGSSDGSLSVLQRAASLYREIQVIQKPNSGHGE